MQSRNAQEKGAPKTPTAVRGWWLLLYPYLVVMTIVGIALLWDKIPDPFPNHYGVSFQPDGYLPKEITSVASMCVLQAILALVFVGCHYLVKRAPRSMINPKLPKTATAADEARYRLLTSRFLLVAGVCTTALIGLIWLLTITSALNTVAMIALIGVLLAVIIGGTVILFMKQKKLG